MAIDRILTVVPNISRLNGFEKVDSSAGYFGISFTFVVTNLESLNHGYIKENDGPDISNVSTISSEVFLYVCRYDPIPLLVDLLRQQSIF